MIELIKKYVKDVAIINFSIMVLLAIYLAYLLFPTIVTIFSFVIGILSPFLLALIFYYLLRPLFYWLQKKIPKYLAIFFVYLFLSVIFAVVVLFIYPEIQGEIQTLKSASERIAQKDNEVVSLLDFVKHNITVETYFKDILTKILVYLNDFLIQNIMFFLSTITEFIIAFGISLFILFYFLKDDQKIYAGFIKKVPTKYVKYIKKMFHEFDMTLSHFINGRIIISLIISSLILIAFEVVGLNFAFLLAALSFVFIIIPTVGCFLAMILPLLVGFSTNAFLGIEVFIIMGVASMLEGLLLTPQVMGRQLYIHPLTVMLLLLAGGSIFGVIGLLFAAPLYALIKIFYMNTFNFVNQELSAHNL